MHLYYSFSIILTLLACSVVGAPSKAPLVKRCTNSAADRSCWSDGFDLSTNYYDEAPDTGVTREVCDAEYSGDYLTNFIQYFLELVNTTLAPDGVSRNVLLVNGTFPGPTLFADWVIVYKRRYNWPTF
jgi:hypothetical protein